MRLRSSGRRTVFLSLLGLAIVVAAVAAIYMAVQGRGADPTVAQPPAAVASARPGEWPAYMYDAGRSGFNPTETQLSPDNAQNLKLLWKKKLGEGKPLAAQPIVYSNTLYVGSWDGYLYAMDPATGNERWKKDLGLTKSALCFPPEAGVTSAPAVTDDALYIGGGDDKFYALNPANGDTLWTFDIGDNSEQGGAYNWASPVIDRGLVYYSIASLCDRPFVNGELWGFDLATGEVKKHVHFVPPGQKGGGLWTSPTVDQATGAVFVTTGSGDYYIPHSYSMARLDPETMQVVDAWQIPIEVQVFDGDWGTTPTLFHHSDGRLMVGAAAKNGYFYAFDANNIHSGPAWSVRIADGGSCPQCGEGAISTSAYAYDTVYVAAGYNSLGQVHKFPGTVTALDPSTGAIKWQHPTSSWVIPALAVANGLVVAAAEDTVEVINAATGELVWEYATERAIYAPPTLTGGVLYVPSTDGHVYAFSAGPYPENTTAYPVATVGANPPPFTAYRTPIPAPPLEGEEQCFDNKLCVRGAFLQFWRDNGGMERLGSPASEELNEAGRTVQYFRNAMLQLDEKDDGSREVRLGKLDFRLFYYTPLNERFNRVDAVQGATYFQETGHNLTEPFLSYWRSHGEVAALGYPVSEPYDEFNILTLQVDRVQYFERARLEMVPNADGTKGVQMGALGFQKYLWRYGKMP